MCIQNEAPIRTETNTQYLLLLKFSVQTSARRRTRSGGPRTARTGAERRHRTFKPRPTLEKKNDTDLVSFFFQARDGDRSLFPRCKGFPTACPWKPCNGERSICPLHWLLCFSPAKSWGAAAGGSITPNF